MLCRSWDEAIALSLAPAEPVGTAAPSFVTWVMPAALSGMGVAPTAGENVGEKQKQPSTMRIEDYAMIGDCQSAALVGTNGSIDWLCLPRFDSPACFAALLGDEENGYWLLAPRGEVRSCQRRYRPGTLILETDFTTDEGTVSVIDFMTPRSAEPDVVRIIVGRRGRVAMRCDLVIRCDYGSIVPWVRRSGNGIWATAGPDSVILYAGVALHGENFHSVGEFTVAAGDRVPFVLMWFPSHEPKPEPLAAEAALQHTERWWRDWSDRCTFAGPEREAVVRSLITLKALIYAPTGGIVAAPTTSLPEQLGGVRNWDYRYCWVRDATYTLNALLIGGYTEEACAWREWLLRAMAGKPSELNIMYGLAGERRLPELELPWLAGYEGAQPVRVGNQAWQQYQLDVYGELMDTLSLARAAGLHPDDNAWRVELALTEFLESGWRQADNGIWEMRGPRRHFTHSKVMAWVAFDRMIQAVERFHLNGPVERWRDLRQTIHAEICAEGYDAAQNTFVQYYGASEPDASLLMMPLVGFLPATDERMRGTVAAIERTLMPSGFVTRYVTHVEVDGLPPGEGAFLPCTFWLADNYVLAGRQREARALFERLLGLRSDVGLLAEEYDVANRRLVGNFPQALSHIALINTAYNLARADAR